MAIRPLLLCALSLASLVHCGSTTGGESGTGDGAAAETAPEDGGMCFVDYPCFDGPFLCTGTSTYVPVVSHDCHYKCGPGPCSGGSCDPSGPEQTCPSGTVCMKGRIPDGVKSPCFAPGTSLDGGAAEDAPDGGA